MINLYNFFLKKKIFLQKTNNTRLVALPQLREAPMLLIEICYHLMI